MGRLITGLIAVALGAAVMGCAPTIDKTAGWLADMDCKLDRLDRGQPMCYPKVAVAEAPLYCYKTIGGVECYSQPDRFVDNRAPVNPAPLPVNSLGAKDMPPGTVPGGRPAPLDLALANPEGRDGAKDAVRREIALLNAKIEAERLAVAVPMAPTLSEPLVEPPKVEPTKKPPAKRTARGSSTGRPTPITRPAAPRAPRPAVPQAGADAARPMTDAEGAALADRQRQ